jgi:hypothetical protein
LYHVNLPQNGVHKLSADTGQIAKDTLKLLKTQDIGYVKGKAQSEQKVGIKVSARNASHTLLGSFTENRPPPVAVAPHPPSWRTYVVW